MSVEIGDMFSVWCMVMIAIYLTGAALWYSNLDEDDED